MDNQSLLFDEFKCNIPTCSSNVPVNIPMRTIKPKRSSFKNSFENRYSSELDSILECESINSIPSQARTKPRQPSRLSSSKSLKNPGILMTSNIKSHELNIYYRYHCYFIYHPNDKTWVQSFVRKLESSPYDYKCCLDCRDYIRSNSNIQNIICSIMLSERVVLVISEAFLANIWTYIEDILLNTAANCQILSKTILVLLEHVENCSGFPNCLRECQALYADNEQFWELFLMSLRRESSNLNSSSSTLWSMISQTTPLVNGQIMYIIKITSRLSQWWSCRPDYHIEIDSSPQSTALHESAINSLVDDSTLESILHRLSLHDSDDFSLVLESHWPVFIMIVTALLWILGFVLVILHLPDQFSYTLPVRLSVFVFPAGILLSCLIIRWKMLEIKKNKRINRISNRMIPINWEFYSNNLNIALTTEYNIKFNCLIIYLVYYSLFPCLETIRQILKPLKAHECEVLRKLFENALDKVSNINSPIVTKSLHELICLVLLPTYLTNLLSHKLPLHTSTTSPTSPKSTSQSSSTSTHSRHTRKYLCLCQYAEDVLICVINCLIRHHPTLEQQSPQQHHHNNNRFNSHQISRLPHFIFNQTLLPIK